MNYEVTTASSLKCQPFQKGIDRAEISDRICSSGARAASFVIKLNSALLKNILSYVEDLIENTFNKMGTK
jgi:hypothetical protein